MPVSSPSSTFHGFASHTSPPLNNAQYSETHPKSQQYRKQQSKQHPYLPQSGPISNSTNQPVVYTEVHSELGIVQPKTAKKISNATSLNDFNIQPPQSGRVLFDVPQRNRKTLI